VHARKGLTLEGIRPGVRLSQVRPAYLVPQINQTQHPLWPIGSGNVTLKKVARDPSYRGL
jgi:hypothetical protein